MPSKLRDPNGFTLTELMITVAIIGILAAIAVPEFITLKDKATLAVAKANLHTVRSALSDYAASKDDFGYPLDGSMDQYTDLCNMLSPYGLTFKPPSVGGTVNDNKWAQYNGYSLNASGYTVTITANDSSGTTLRAYLHGLE